MAKIIIADSHHILLSGLTLIINEHPGFEVLATCTDAQDAYVVASRLRPDIVVIETHMEGLSPFVAAHNIKNECPGVKICFLTGHDDESTVRDAVQVKADGYVLKLEDSRKLTEALRTIERGGRWYSQRVSQHLLSPGKMRVDTLTPRERLTLKMLAEGNAVKEIAVALGLSIKTVEAHKLNLMRKLDVHKNAHLVCYAIQNNIISIPGVTTATEVRA